MLNVNVIPTALVEFYHNYRQVKQTPETVTKWWEDFKTFVEQYKFCNDEYREQYLSGDFDKLKVQIELIQKGDMPTARLVKLSAQLSSALMGLLMDETDYLIYKERDDAFKSLLPLVENMTYRELERTVNEVLNFIPRSELKELYNAAVDNGFKMLTRCLEEYQLGESDERTAKTIAYQVARIRILQSCDEKDLSYLLRNFRHQPLFIAYSVDTLEKRGIVSMRLMLDYIAELEKEYAYFSHGEPKILDQPNARVYTAEKIEEAKVEFDNDPLAFVNGKNGQRLWSRVDNLASSIIRRREIEKVQNVYVPGDALKQRYAPDVDRLEQRLKETTSKLVAFRNEVENRDVYKFLNEVITQYNDSINSFPRFASKRSKRYSESQVMVAEILCDFVITHNEEEILKFIEMIK